MRIATRSIGPEYRAMFIEKVCRSVETGADEIRRALQRLVYETRGIHLPPKFSLGRGTRLVSLAKCEAEIRNGLNLGDYNLLKFYEPSKIVLGENVTTRRSCIFQLFGGELAIGNNVFFNNHCSVTCFGKIEIGDNTFFGEGVKMYDHNHKHEFRGNGLYAFPTEFKIGQIKIGKNCWVASNVTILNNVTIGDSVIVGAGCLIYKTVPSNTIVMRKEELIFKQAKQEDS
jgi:acetyltransferase-like isoleucine patch superfamily enzyme